MDREAGDMGGVAGSASDGGESGHISTSASSRGRFRLRLERRKTLRSAFLAYDDVCRDFNHGLDDGTVVSNNIIIVLIVFRWYSGERERETKTHPPFAIQSSSAAEAVMVTHVPRNINAFPAKR